MGVGTSRTELSRAGFALGHAIDHERHWNRPPHCIRHVETALEFDLLADGPQPASYLFDDGTDDTDHDVKFTFDWQAGRVRGTAEDRAVDIATVPGLQDPACMQALVLARLRAGQEPGTVAMVEKDKVKYYRYTLLRRETLKTAIGNVETVVYRAARDGSDRETLTWYAPKLGFAAVQAQQLTAGKRGFQTYIRRLQPGN
jgi:hypothetical protein